jgi:hypothetical protein
MRLMLPHTLTLYATATNPKGGLCIKARACCSGWVQTTYG